jgi:hypothetical protein
MTIPPELLALLPAATRQQLAVNGGNLCLSGAARGADTLWGEAARRSGHALVHWSFAGHHGRGSEADVVELSPGQLAIADPHLAQAAQALHRAWPPASDHAANLLRRDYFQAAWSDSLYAIADRDRRGRIKSGTAWAVQIFVERFAARPCRAYLFDQGRRNWARWAGDAWTDIGALPKPAGIWAGIGTRDLRPEGADAIAACLAQARRLTTSD